MSTVLPALWFFMLGAAMGSFFNVLIDRLPEGRDVIFTRSACSECGTKLKAADLVPIFSYLFLGGRCRYCKTKLSPWYFISELVVGGLYLLAFLRFAKTGSAVELIGFLLLWSLLFTVAVMDYQTGMIMDLFPVLIGAAGVVTGLLAGRPVREILFGILTGALCFGGLYLICRLILKREGLGLGDVFLLTGLGAWLPAVQVVICVFLTAYVALVFILIKAFKEKKIGLKTEFPLGPSICIAAFIMSLWGDAITGFLARLILR